VLSGFNSSSDHLETKTTRMRTNRLSQLATARDPATITCVLQPGGGGERLYRKGSLQGCSVERLLPWGSWRLTRNGASYVIGLGNIFDFLWLVLSWTKNWDVGSY